MIWIFGEIPPTAKIAPITVTRTLMISPAVNGFPVFELMSLSATSFRA